jgi:tetratricopeptide (TPR) repeat protein
MNCTMLAPRALRLRLGNVLLLLLAFAAIAAAQISVIPQQAVAGRTLTINVAESQSGKMLNVSTPLGKFRKVFPVGPQRSFEITVPADAPLLLVGIMETEEPIWHHKIITVVNNSGVRAKRESFWRAYLLSGIMPTPFPLKDTDIVEAMRYAQKSVIEDPDYIVAKALLWRLEARNAYVNGKHLSVVEDIDKRLAAAPEGRLATSVAAIHIMVGDYLGAQDINEKYKDLISPILNSQALNWQEVSQTNNMQRRINIIHQWLATDPLSSYVTSCFQLLAPAYMQTGQYRSTALFGYLSLKFMPEDAMTLNGVAYAMAEGEFMLEQGLGLADKAIALLSGSMQKPTNRSDAQWDATLREARAATMDTKGWLLTKMERWAEAKKAFQTCLLTYEKDEFYIHYAEMLNRSGSIMEAQIVLQKGIKLNGPRRFELEEMLRNLNRKR